MIDDIDRLSVDEIRQLFTVVKAIADFPQVVYLLAFDRQVVEAGLDGVQGAQPGAGAAYLEKIVQVPLELPTPDKAALRQLFIEKINPVLGEYPDELEDEGRAIRTFLGGVDHFIKTPRDVFRIVNALTVTYVVVQGEVNPYDFVAIEALRIFSPLVFDAIRTNKDLFAGSVHFRTSNYATDDGTASKKVFYDNMLNQLSQEDRGPVKQILLALFPRLDVVWGGTSYGADWERTWRRTLRICSSSRFDTYFRLSIPAGAISNAEMRRILSSLEDKRTFEAELRRLIIQKAPDGGSRVQAFLWLLQDYIKQDIQLAHVRPMIEAIMQVGDEVIIEEPLRQHWLFSFPSDTVVRLTIEKLLKLTAEADRLAILAAAIEESDSVSTMTSVLYYAGRQHGKYRWPQEVDIENHSAVQEELLLTLEQIEQLERLVASKIRYAAKSGTVLRSLRLQFILRVWQWIDDSEQVQQWARTTFLNDDALLTLLEKFLNRTTITSLDYGTQTFEYSLDPKSLRDFVSLREVYERLPTLENLTNLNEKQQKAIQCYRTAYDLLMEKGQSNIKRKPRVRARRGGLSRPRFRRLRHVL